MAHYRVVALDKAAVELDMERYLAQTDTVAAVAAVEMGVSQEGWA